MSGTNMTMTTIEFATAMVQAVAMPDVIVIPAIIVGTIVGWILIRLIFREFR